MTSADETIRRITDVLQREAAAIVAAATRVGSTAATAVELLSQCQGRVIVTGMGKAGSIARKAAATFCSTGTPAIFLHPAEAVHGDLGIMAADDVMIALSNSGETQEVISLLPHLQRLGIPTICLTGNLNSTLANNSTVTIDSGVDVEADPLELAPTSSTTVMLALCDALAVAVMSQQGFTAEQFAIFHPGGQLGRKLLLKVNDLMHSADRIPAVAGSQSLKTAMTEISAKKQGCVFILDDDSKQLRGVVTDGDLRRYFQSAQPGSEGWLDCPVTNMMTQTPAFIHADALAAAAMKLMEDREITVLPVVTDTMQLIGVLHLHDLIRAGLA